MPAFIPSSVVAKDLATYRVDGGLRRAVADEAASRGETVTDVIIRAFREYITEDPPKRSRTARPEPPPKTRQAPANASCHPRLRPGSYCKTCGRIA